ncbi:HAD family hydrolase [Haladaptatus sp. CMAA 1911]|uniref:HAD family hydrolase n=1 Tax=unclassified Haladaptatus TaxID=2622732 RepID=UPI00375440B6
MCVTAVGLDLDETLAVTDRPREKLLADATQAVNAPSLSRQEYLDAHGRHLTSESRKPIFADLLADSPEAGADELTDAYQRAILDALAPLGDIPSLLAELRREYRVGLLTNGPVAAQRGKLAELGWEDHFDATVVTGELDAGKPDPHAFEALCEALDVSPAEMVYVGDNPEMDVRGANEAGIRTVQVLYPDGPDPEPVADAYVDRDELVNTLPEIIASLDTCSSDPD